jgi:hypothetical protein
VFFLVRCVFWLAGVFMVLPWPVDAPAPPAVSGRSLSATEPATKPRVRRAAASAAPRDDDVLGSLSREATDKLAQAAREHCSVHPRECLSILGVGAPPEPRRR